MLCEKQYGEATILLKSTHGQNLKKTYSALIVVLEHLIFPGDYQVNDCVPEQLGHGTVKGFMTFEEALSIYLDAAEKPLSKEREDDTKIRFRDMLLHPEHGLRCLIYTLFLDNVISYLTMMRWIFQDF